MPDIILKDFSAGLDGRRLNAPVNSLARARDVKIASGSLYAHERGVNITPEGIRFSTFEKSLVDLIGCADRLIGKLDNVLVHVTPPAISGQPATISPMWMRDTYCTGYETVTRIGDFYYISAFAPKAEPEDYCLRWDGQTHRYVMAVAGGTPPAGMTGWTLTNMRNDLYPGWLFWYGTYSNGITSWAGRVRVTRVQNGPAVTTVYTEAVANPENYNRCCLVNIDRIGIPAPHAAENASLPPTTALKAGGSLAAGDYQYLFRFVSADTPIGTETYDPLFRGIDDVSNPSDPCTAVTVPGGSGEQTITVTIPEANEFPSCVTSIEVYRRVKPSGGAYGDWKLIKTQPAVSITAVPGYRTQVKTFAFDDDGGLAEGGILPGDAYYHEVPGMLRLVRAFNGRLYGAEAGTHRNRLRFSTLGAPNSWPYDAAGVLSYVDDTRYLGGYQDVGNDAHQIVAILPEGGTFSNTGQVGDNLLILKGFEAYRWYGTHWADFRLQYGFSMGCSAMRTAHNCGGNIVWLSDGHIMTLPSGGSHPQAISKSIYPNGISPTGEEFATYWKNNYIFCFGSTYLILDADTGTWTTANLTPDLTGGVVGLAPLAGINTYTGDYQQLYFGRSLTGLRAGFGMALVGALSASVSVVTQPLLLASSTEDAMRLKRIRRIYIGYRNLGKADVPVYVAIWGDDGVITTISTDVAAHTGPPPEQTVVLPVDGPAIAHVFQLEIGADASSASAFAIDWIGLDFEYLPLVVSRPSGLLVDEAGSEPETPEGAEFGDI